MHFFSSHSTDLVESGPLQSAHLYATYGMHSQITRYDIFDMI